MANSKTQAQKKNVWVVGASSGIGRAVAQQLVHEGHFVVLSGRNVAALESMKSQAPTRIACVAFDLTDQSHWVTVTQQLAGIVDQLDLVIYAAGVCEYVDTVDTGLALYRRVFEVNFFAAVQTLNCALPLLKRSDNRPRMAAVGSLSAQAAFTRAQAYGASKAALEYWLDCQRIDLQNDGIAVSVISPGFVETPMTANNDFAMPAMMSAQSAAKIIVRGLDQERMHIRFPKRLYWPLRIAGWVPKLWFGWLADRLQRSQSL